MPAYSVSSWFIDQTILRAPTVARKFTIGSSDYSDRVLRWPKISRRWNDIRPANITINLTNEDQTFNFFKDTKTLMRSSCKIEMGFTHPTSGDEFITMFDGTVERVRYNRGATSIQMMDKIKPFTEKVLGTSDAPLEYVGSNYLPSDIAWWLATSYGGMSTLTDTTNPDIDYEAFSAWADVFSSDNVYVNARYEGVKLNDALRRIGRMTQSAIVVENNKLTFARYTEASSFKTLLDDDAIKSLELSIDDTKIVNKQHVFADYSVESSYFQIAVLSVESTSVDSYGAREEIEKDEAFWYVSSATALNLAQRMTDLLSEPFEQYIGETTLVPLARQIGETVLLVDSFYGVDSSENWRIMGYDINLDNGETKVKFDGSQVYQPFTLDDDFLGLLDQSYNRLL